MIPKFRAWVKPGVLSNHPDGVVAEAKPNFLDKVCLVKRHDLVANECFTEIFDFEDVELMQSTGLKDKNGVEIFDGDFLTDSEVRWIVKYSETECGFSAMGIGETGCWSLYHLANGGKKGRLIEVIGNI